MCKGVPIICAYTWFRTSENEELRIRFTVPNSCEFVFMLNPIRNVESGVQCDCHRNVGLQEFRFLQ